MLSLSPPGDDGGTAALESALAAIVLEMLELVSNGRGFQVIPFGDELTTWQAADFLNVPLRYLEEHHERDEILFVEAKRHRRVCSDDLSAYARKRDAKRSEAIRNRCETRKLSHLARTNRGHRLNMPL